MPQPYIDRYRGRFDHGWDAWRDEVFARQQASGLLPAGHPAQRAPGVDPAVGRLGDDERRLYARMMEVYAGFLEHTDAQVGRVLDFIDALGELDNTIVLVMSDNGASAEGGPHGSFNENYFFNIGAREPRGEPAAHRRPRRPATPTTTTRGAGRGPATRRSSGGSGRPTRAGSPIR